MNPLFHHIFQCSRYLSKELNHVLKTHGLFASQWSILYCIYQHKQVTLTEIWTYLNVEAPTVTRTVQRLAELGWVKVTHGEDRREKVVSLTDKAIHAYPNIERTIIEYENQFLQHLSPTEQEQLSALLRKMKKREEIDH